MRLLQSLVIAFSMYSKIPMPRVDWNKDNMKYAMCFFPVVGIVIGIVTYIVGNLLFLSSCSDLFRAVVMTLIPLLISGGIHMDGFMDTMDALASYGDREKKLRILKDSHAGAFAIIGFGCYCLWSLAVWSQVSVEMLGVISGIFVVSRSLSGLSIVTFPPAREDGLARTFQDGAHKKKVGVTMVVFLIAVFVLLFWQNWLLALGAAVAVALVFAGYKRMSTKQFGGITGDLAGFFLQLAELMMITGIILAGGALWS